MLDLFAAHKIQTNTHLIFETTIVKEQVHICYNKIQWSRS